MAELKLSTVWEIKDFAEKNAAIATENPYCVFYSDDFTALEQKSFPGLTWSTSLYTASPNEADCQKGFAGFGLAYSCDANVWATYSATVLDKDGRDLVTFCSADAEYPNQVWKPDAFKIEDFSKAVRDDGSLCIRIDLSILQIGEILKCRKLLRGLLTNKALAYFKVGVEEEAFSLHKLVLAEASSVFADMFERQTAEEKDITIPLLDTNPSAFKAFSEALYGDKWAFSNGVDLTQDVLYLAEKFKVADLKRHCDESLAEKINAENALEVLAKTAALCNAEKTKAACISILVGQMEFKQSQIWLDFKKHNFQKAMEILDTVSDKLSDTIDFLQREHAAVTSDLRRKHEDEQRESTDRHVALESTLRIVKSALLQKDLNLAVASVVESQLRAENARLGKGGGKLHERVIELWCQCTQKGFENVDLKTALQRQEDKLKEAAVAESQLRTENALLAEEIRRFCALVRTLQNQIAQKELKNADLKTAVQQQDEKLKQASAVESQLRTENIRLEEDRAGLCERVDELQEQIANGALEVAGLQLLRKEQDDKLEEVSAVASKLRTENARLEEKSAVLYKQVDELQQQNAQANLELADLKLLREKQDDELEEVCALEWRRRTEIGRLEEKSAGLSERVCKLDQLNAAGNLEVAELKTILGLRDDALNLASVVEAQLRTDIAQLEEIRADLTGLVSELQQNAEESGELAKLQDECSVCMEQYSAARPKEVLYRCGHCFCSVCVDRVKNAARSRRGVGNNPVEFKCPICKAVFYDVVRLFNN